MKTSYDEFCERATAEIYTARTAYYLLGEAARLVRVSISMLCDLGLAEPWLKDEIWNRYNVFAVYVGQALDEAELKAIAAKARHLNRARTEDERISEGNGL